MEIRGKDRGNGGVSKLFSLNKAAFQLKKNRCERISGRYIEESLINSGKYERYFTHL